VENVTTKRRIYRGRIYSGPFPVENLKRVERPTTSIMEDKVQRVDERESGFRRAGRGDFGPVIKKEYSRFVQKHPLSGALRQMMGHMIPKVDGPVAQKRAPLPNDPEVMSLHIKETAYFLRSDAVGICKLPPYAVYSHSAFDGQPVELHRPDGKWWLDLEDIDGELQISFKS